MATDYDAPRTRPEDEPVNESLGAIQVQRSATTQTAVIDAEFFDTAEGIDLPGADLSREEHSVQVVPEQADEFTYGSSFLVRHRSQLPHQKNGASCCSDCEG
ncbi:DUF4193 domain-containing protein [Kocuria sp. CPCC 205263]|jgi:hypothetical protein|uniref:DUF4193 domain-containing protein n=1 Tax=Kocuria sp. CPCC 205263 TaxID=3073555 RepID=UPI0034D66C75